MTTLSGLQQRCSDFGHRFADAGIGFDLGAQELPDELVRAALGLARLEDADVGVGEEVAGLGVDEEELLFDAQVDHCFVLLPISGLLRATLRAGYGHRLDLRSGAGHSTRQTGAAGGLERGNQSKGFMAVDSSRWGPLLRTELTAGLTG